MNEIGSATAPDGGLSIELAPGVVFPNWSAVSSETVAEALAAIFDAFGVEKCWTGMGGEEDRVRRTVLAEFAETGHAPSPARLAEMTGMPLEEVGQILRCLKDRDLVVLDDSDTLVGAYPFTERDTGHRVLLDGTDLNAMCAIDALGTGAMYGHDTQIRSSCRNCGRAVHIETGEKGERIAALSPENAIVWSGIQVTDGCSADTMCTIMAFFCSDDCLNSWRGDNAAGIEGFRLSMDEGLQAGKAIFTPLLAAPSDDAEIDGS